MRADWRSLRLTFLLVPCELLNIVDVTVVLDVLTDKVGVRVLTWGYSTVSKKGGDH